ncbi:hypothetical protein VDGL01_08619 [Verticillium dahliae]
MASFRTLVVIAVEPEMKAARSVENTGELLTAPESWLLVTGFTDEGPTIEPSRLPIRVLSMGAYLPAIKVLQE